MKQKVAAQLKEELKGRPEAEDSKKREELVNAAFDKAAPEDEGYQNARREHDRAVSHWECHYFGSARVYCLVGYGLAEAMKCLVPKP